MVTEDTLEHFLFLLTLTCLPVAVLFRRQTAPFVLLA
jgi:hypothetical protein